MARQVAEDRLLAFAQRLGQGDGGGAPGRAAAALDRLHEVADHRGVGGAVADVTAQQRPDGVAVHHDDPADA